MSANNDLTMTVGYCPRGPATLEFARVSTGHVLITGDNLNAVRAKLRTLIDAAQRIPNSFMMQTIILTQDHEKWSTFVDMKNVLGVFTPAMSVALAKEIDELEHHIVDISTGRGSDRYLPTVLVVVDDLSIIPGLPVENNLQMDYLLQFGLRAGVYVVACGAVTETTLYERFYSKFKTVLIGQHHYSRRLDALVDYGSDIDSESLGEAFAMKVQGTWFALKEAK